MTNEELVKQLCDLGQYEAANRIEELEFCNEQLRDERDWYRERVVWGFYEDEEPKYYQGKEGESEICDPVTAEEVTRLLQGWNETEAMLKRAVDALLWCSGSADFQEGGVAREGWLKLCVPIIEAEPWGYQAMVELKGANP